MESSAWRSCDQCLYLGILNQFAMAGTNFDVLELRCSGGRPASKEIDGLHRHHDLAILVQHFDIHANDPKSGLDLERRASSAVTRIHRESPGADGLRQRSSSMPGMHSEATLDR